MHAGLCDIVVRMAPHGQTKTSNGRPGAWVPGILLICILPGCAHRSSPSSGEPAPIVPPARGGATADREVRLRPEARTETVTTDNVVLDTFLHRRFQGVAGTEGRWMLSLAGVRVIILTDERADRMRAMAQVTAEALEPERLRLLLEANFDRALDAKYAVWRGELWAVFVHPLSVLGEAELESGVVQVVNLVKTYGTTYSSTGLQFGGGQQEESDTSPPRVF